MTKDIFAFYHMNSSQILIRYIWYVGTYPKFSKHYLNVHAKVSRGWARDQTTE